MQQDRTLTTTSARDLMRDAVTAWHMPWRGTLPTLTSMRTASPNVRLVGWITLVGGCLHAALFAASALMLAGVAPALKFLDEQHWLAHLCEVPGMALLAFGIFGMYRHYRDVLGPLGRVGAYLAVGGLAAEALGGMCVGIAEPTTGVDMRDGIWLPLTHTPGLVGILLGSLLFGAALTQKRVLSRRATAPVLAAVGLFILAAFAPIGEGGFMALPALISAAWAWTGYTLVAHSEVARRHRSWTGRPGPLSNSTSE